MSVSKVSASWRTQQYLPYKNYFLASVINMTKIAINGFGRIGRLAARVIVDKFGDRLELVAINTSGSMEPAAWAHLWQYDSVYGKFPKTITADGNYLTVGKQRILLTGEKDPAKIPWQKAQPEIVLECTGKLRKEAQARPLLTGSVKKAILSAPAKEGHVPMYVIGVNCGSYQGEDLVSCASCTTNCVAPVMSVLEKKIGIKKALLNTVHSYTSDQRLLDNSHKDLRRARGAAINIVPTSTGAAKATGKIIKPLAGLFDGVAIRVPVATVSLADMVIVTARRTSAEEVNKMLSAAAEKELKGIINVSHEPLVSTDMIGSSYSATVDSELTNVVDGDLVRVVAWYDNEWGYTNRLVELAIKISNF